MTVADDLATLIRQHANEPWTLAALRSVEAEIARLEQLAERQATNIVALYRQRRAAEAEKERWKAVSQFRRERQKQAEAEVADRDREAVRIREARDNWHAAYVKERAEIARLTENQMVRYERGDDFSHDFWKERAEAAEAEVARLRDGLRFYATEDDFGERARALLAEDGFGTDFSAEVAERLAEDGAATGCEYHHIRVNGCRACDALAEDGAASVEMYEGDLPTMDGATTPDAKTKLGTEPEHKALFRRGGAA